MAKRINKLIILIAGNIILIILFLLSLELIASLFTTVQGGNIVAHPRLNHTWRPNFSHKHDEFINKSNEFNKPYIHYYNSQGWLEKYDIQKEKPVSTYRIFYVGDSFTEGTCPMEQSVPSIVEERLNKMAADKNISFEVINTGTLSYSPTIYYLLVRYALMDYSPDLIVVNVDMTDVFDDWKYSQNLIKDSDGNPLFALPRDLYRSSFVDTEYGAVSATIFLKIRIFLMQHSYAYNLIWKLKEKIIHAIFKPESYNAYEDYNRWAWCKNYWDDFTKKNVQNSIDILRSLIIFCKNNKIKVMLTGVPHYWQYAGSVDGSGGPRWSNRPHYELARLCAEMDIPFLNSFKLLEPVITGTPQKKFYYENDMHFNPRGYAVWADIHIKFLIDKSNRLLPDSFFIDSTY